ncbi:hypothetical protein IE4872_PB00001 (plasmid) [Rhizobium gallicum]|uniref:Uncharacterized protein n=2 Tax=Rhizobium gallicum TaxID=56730 RepID=A0A0B4X5G6_9HYPH|nr:hypothetical protein RGR602_PA00001 [Rhizobium gallicum bv. gallicum R602sp]APO69875.1 hypothetical protein IE4872_PB00001 [Rhizobium gallicum]
MSASCRSIYCFLVPGAASSGGRRLRMGFTGDAGTTRAVARRQRLDMLESISQRPQGSLDQFDPVEAAKEGGVMLRWRTSLVVS